MTPVNRIAKQIKQEIDKTVRISYEADNIQTLNPIYEWGQNKTHILIRSKFAHRWGSPGA